MVIVPSKMIEDMKSAVDGQVIDRSRVIDHLLDLRLEVSADEHFTASVDEVLGDVPGLNVVEAEWWQGTLDHFATLAARLPA